MVVNERTERAGNPTQVKMQAGQARDAVAICLHEPLVSDWLFFLLNNVDRLAIALVATLQVIPKPFISGQDYRNQLIFKQK